MPDYTSSNFIWNSDYTIDNGASTNVTNWDAQWVAFRAAYMAKADASIKEAELRKELDNQMALLTPLRALQIERQDMDELVALSALGEIVVAQYSKLSLDAPDWLKESLISVNDEIRSRRKDYLRKQLAQKKLALESLKTREQKRSETEAEIKKLEEALK